MVMEDGDIKSPSIETPNKVIETLVGEENLDQLESFLAPQYEWVGIKFALESLCSPSVIGHTNNDPQLEIAINSLDANQETLKILDFDTVKGREAQEILRNKELAKKHIINL
jgi:hypothetical protein